MTLDRTPPRAAAPAPGLVLAALPPAALLAVDPGGLAPFGPGKWLLIPTLVLGGFALAARRGGLRAAVRPMVAWGVFLAVATIAAATGLDRLYAWTGTPERRFGLVTWVLCALAFVGGQALDRRAGRLVALGSAVAVGVTGAWALAESTGWEPLDLVGAGDRPVGLLGSSAYLGAAACLLAPVAGGVATDPAFRPRLRIACAVAAGLGVAALVVSGARAAWAGALVAAVVVVARRRPAKRVVAAGAAVIVVAIALGALTAVTGRVPEAWSDRDGGARGRLDEWRVAARVVRDHPLLGVGPEGYRIAFGAAVDDEYERAHGRVPLPDRAHSSVLDVAATTGATGLVAYLALLGVTGAVVLAALGGGPNWLFGAAAGLLAYAAQSVLLFPLAELDPLAWLLAGIVVGHSGSGAVLALRTKRVVPALAAVLAVVALAVGVLDVTADRRAKDALDRDVATDPTGAARLRPDVVRYRLAAARAYERLDSSLGVDRAIAQVEHALDVSPRDPVALGERARLLLARARRSGMPDHARAAVTALEEVAGDDPRNAALLLRLGVARALAGRHARAERAWLAAERLAPRSSAASTNLAFAYDAAGRHAEARAAARRALSRDPRAAHLARLRRLAGT